MRILYFVICFLVCMPSVHAGNEGHPTGARRLGMGGAYASVRGDMWSLWANPAGITGIQRFEGGLFTERRFFVQEISNAAFGAVLPFKEKHAAGISAASFGFGAYRENNVGLSYATTLYENIHLGVKFNFLNLAIANYGSVTTFYADAGVMADVSKRMRIGFWTQNINQAKIGALREERLPILINGGVSYRPSEKVIVTADAVKTLDYPLGIRAGFEYFFIDHFCARAGYSTSPASMHFGAGFRLDNISIDFANSIHERLGYTPHLSVTLRLGNKKTEEIADTKPKSETPKLPKTPNTPTKSSSKPVKQAVSVTATKKESKDINSKKTTPTPQTPDSKK